MPWKKTRTMSSGDWLVARWMLIMRPAVVTATLGAAILVMPLEYIEKTPITAIVIGTYILSLLYITAHYLSGVSRHLLAMQIAFDIFIVTVIVHYTGGYESFFFGFYLLTIMCASLFFRRLITVMFATQAAIFYIVDLFVFGQDIPPDYHRVAYYQTGLYCLLMYAIGFISTYYAERLRGKDHALTNALKLLKEAKLDTWDILQSMTNGLITLDTHGRLIYMNNVAESILESDRAVAVGKRYETVFGERTAELVGIIARQMDDSSAVTENDIIIHNKNNVVVPLGITSMPLYDTDGSRRGVIFNFKDLTEKKKLLEMIRQSERMAAIGGLSAAIAHEIRNPLASICNAVEILSEIYDAKDPQDTKLLEVIEKESARLQKISTDFLDFARMKNPDMKSLNLRDEVENALILINNDPLKKDDIIIVNSIPDGIKVLFDDDQLRQLILNVLINSLQALSGQGNIEICIEYQPDSTDDYVRLVISDDGPGFQIEALGSMFEPFFSTRKEGTGLGLALVRKISFSNRGRVFARNRQDSGAELILDMLKSGAEL